MSTSGKSATTTVNMCPPASSPSRRWLGWTFYLSLSNRGREKKSNRSQWSHCHWRVKCVFRLPVFTFRVFFSVVGLGFMPSGWWHWIKGQTVEYCRGLRGFLFGNLIKWKMNIFRSPSLCLLQINVQFQEHKIVNSCTKSWTRS